MVTMRNVRFSRRRHCCWKTLADTVSPVCRWSLQELSPIVYDYYGGRCSKVDLDWNIQMHEVSLAERKTPPARSSSESLQYKMDLLHKD